MAKISKKLRIKWNFELTVFELTVPDLYCISISEAKKEIVLLSTVKADDKKKNIPVIEIGDSDDHESKSSILSSQFSSHDRDSDSLRLRFSKIKHVKRLVNKCFVKKIPFTEPYVSISHHLATNTNAVSDRELDDLECECLESLSLEKEVSESSSESEHSPKSKTSHHLRRKRDGQHESHTLMKHSHPPYSYTHPYERPYSREFSYNSYDPRRYSSGSSCYMGGNHYYPSAQPATPAHHYAYSSQREAPQHPYEYADNVNCGGSMRYSESDMYSSYDQHNTATPMSSSPNPSHKPFETTQQLPSFEQLSNKMDSVHLSRGSTPDTPSGTVYSDKQYTHEGNVPAGQNVAKYTIHSDMVSSEIFDTLISFPFRFPHNNLQIHDSISLTNILTYDINTGEETH